jgi:Copper transport outer membrane protein, MctB
MFDLRYHVASLTAVFLALAIGIVVGVGISGSVNKGEKSLARAQQHALQQNLDQARARIGALSQQQRGAASYLNETYRSVMHNRLKRKRIAVLYVGSDPSLGSLLSKTLRDAGSTGPARIRAVQVPIDPKQLDKDLAGRPALAGFKGVRQLDSLGRGLAQELVAGGDTPLWDALSGQLVAYRAGGSARPADGIVVVRSAGPQAGRTAQFLRGLYSGLAAGGVPAIGVETSGTTPSAIAAFANNNLSTVDNLDQPIGRFALTLLLDGAQPGHYGLKPTASGPLPPLPPPGG